MIGTGLRPKHFTYLQKNTTKLDFLEIISENYMDTQGRPRAVMRRLREKYPMCMHGVSMSLGSASGLRKDYLAKLKALAEEVQPFLISDHLCFTAVEGTNSHDLLPLPFTEEMIGIAARNIDQAQAVLKTQIAIENVSSYLTWKTNEMTEWEFINEIVRQTGCKILLDINNIYVNATNHRYDAIDFLKAIDPEDVAEIHMAGFTDMGDYLFDTHSKPVHRDVWKLWENVAARYAATPVMIERDDDIPSFPVLEKEVLKLAAVRARALAGDRIAS
jgi:uncharacterized protein